MCHSKFFKWIIGLIYFFVVITHELKEPFFKVDDKTRCVAKFCIFSVSIFHKINLKFFMSRLYRPLYYEGKFPTVDESGSKTPDKTKTGNGDKHSGYCECCGTSFEDLQKVFI